EIQDPSLSGTAQMGVQAEAEALTGDPAIDTDMTAAIDAEAGLKATLDGYGPAAAGFFTDEGRTTVSPDADFRATFEALQQDQQAELREWCGGFAGGTEQEGTAASFCAAVRAL